MHGGRGPWHFPAGGVRVESPHASAFGIMLNAVLKPAYDAFYTSFLQVRIGVPSVSFPPTLG